MAKKKRKIPQKPAPDGVAEAPSRSRRRASEPTSAKVKTDDTGVAAPFLDPAQPLFPGPVAVHAAAFAAVFLVTVLFYLPDLSIGFFHLDDVEYIIENPYITEVNARNLKTILTEPYFANYSPVHILSYLVDHSVGGMNPKVFHWSSNLWAGLITGLVYLVAVVFLRHWTVALGAALLFALHPAHVEVVVWLSSRKDLVAAAFAIPSVVAYIGYRRMTDRWQLWYLASITFFVLAIAGKQSVVVLPGLFMVHDAIVERRWKLHAIIDKIPYGIFAVYFALKVMGAQPPTGKSVEFIRICHSFLTNFWLLTGFGEHVVYRTAPDLILSSANRGIAVIILVTIFVAPIALYRFVPRLATFLIYWVLLAMVPPVVLSFVHPVTDRYLYFPSVASCMLTAWGAFAIGRRLKPDRLLAGAMITAILGGAYGYRAWSYIGEWTDPRSVWYGAVTKSRDVFAFLYLGTYYHDTATELQGIVKRSQSPPGDVASSAELIPDNVVRIAETLWADDERLPALLDEWRGPSTSNYPMTHAFIDFLRDLAWEQYELAVAHRKVRIVPNLFYRRGMVQSDRGNLDEAAVEFEYALAFAQEHTFGDHRATSIVKALHSLGVIAWRQRDWPKSMKYMSEALERQREFGGNWIPEIPAQIKRLEQLMGKDKREK